VKSFLTLLLATWLITTSQALADYALPTFSNSLASATHIVDAKVTEITKEQHARLAILKHLKGTNASTVLNGTSLSCFHQPPGRLGMQLGKRYLILLRNSLLFEESSFFEITTNDLGQPGCNLSESQQKWMGLTNVWVPLDQMKRLMMQQN
jgi:hypothetical protein